MTAGQRLAAQQAAKSARKAADRGLDAVMVEEKALAQAAAAKDWLQDNLKPLGMVAAGVLLVAAIGIGWSTVSEGKSRAAGEELAAVLEVDPDDNETLAARYAAVAEAHPGSTAGAWARIGEGRALYALGKFDESRAAYEAALETSEDEMVQWTALEGIAYGYEAEGVQDEALARLDALRSVSSTIAPIAGYHQGRILAEQGKLDDAKRKLEGVLNDLKQPDAPALPYTQELTEARLAVLDPQLAPAAGVDPRKTDELIRQMNEMLNAKPAEE